MYAHHNHPSYDHSRTLEQSDANDLLAHRMTVQRLHGEVSRLRDGGEWDRAAQAQEELDAADQAARDDAAQQKNADRDHAAMLARWAREAGDA